MASPFKFTLTTPVAILIAGVLVAASVFVTSRFESGSQLDQAATQEESSVSDDQDLVNVVAPVSEQDYVRGSATPKITFIEYSDYDCSFCARFHGVMRRVVEEFGDDVAWVYRHFPLNSPEKAIAAECVGSQLRSDAFWRLTDGFLDLENRIALADVPAEFPELDSQQYESCRTSSAASEKVAAQYANAVATGGRGTPWTIIVTESGDIYPLSGARTYEVMEQVVNGLLVASE